MDVNVDGLKYFLWCLDDEGVRKGIVTTKRDPLKMTMNDIVGTYIIDGLGYDEGLENLKPEGEDWISIANIEGDTSDELRLNWNCDGLVGVDVYYFSEELIDINPNRLVSFDDFLKMWYEKSGGDNNFHPSNVYDTFFYDECGIWDGLDSTSSVSRVLWNDCDEYAANTDNVVHYDTIRQVYGSLQCPLNGENITLYNRSGLEPNQLIRLKDMPNFELCETKIDGYIVYPSVNGSCDMTVRFYSDGWNVDSLPVVNYSNKNIYGNNRKYTYKSDSFYYNDIDVNNGRPDTIELDITINSGTYAINMNTSPKIPLTFGDGNTYDLDVVSKTNNAPGYYTVTLNSAWRKSSSVSNPSSTLYDGVYESYSNYNVNSTGAIMYIDIEGYKTFTIYIRSYAESYYDYVMASHLDKSINNNTSYTNTTYVKAHTRGNQQSSTAISGYTQVTYDNIDGGSHRIYIVYRKDSEDYENDDRGYLLISKSNTNYYSEFMGTVTNRFVASCTNSIKYSLAEMGTIRNIDLSQLKFRSYSGGIGDVPIKYHTLYYTKYWIGTGEDERIYIADNSATPDANPRCVFISLDGTVLMSCYGTYDISNKCINFVSASLTSLFEKECYVRVPFKMDGVYQYICFRVKVTTDNFEHVCNSFGDCYFMV